MWTVEAPIETLVVDDRSAALAATVELLAALELSCRVVSFEALDDQSSTSSDLLVVVLVSADDAELARAIERAHALRGHGDHVRLVHALHDQLLPEVGRLGTDVCDEFVLLGRTQNIRLARFWHRCRVERAERAWRLLQTSTVDGVWLLDVGRNVIHWRGRSPGVVEVSGTGDLSGPWDRVDAADRPRVERALQGLMVSNESVTELTFGYRAADGGELVLRATAHVLRGPGGRASLVLGTWTDRTGDERVRRGLVAAERRYRLLLDAMPDAVLVHELGTAVVVDCNAAAVQLLGRSRDELVGRPNPLLPEPSTEHDALVSTTTVTRRTDGAHIPVEISRSLVEVEGRRVALDVVRDLTHRVAAEALVKQREAQLAIASRFAAMGRLAAGIGHEINNPLTTVLANLRVVAESLEELQGLDPDLLVATREAIEGAERVGIIVRDMRSLVKQPVGDAATGSDPAEIVRLAVRTATGEARHWATLETDIASVPSVPIGAGALTQIVLNLLTNATQAFDDRDPRKNRIGVRLSRRDDRVVLEVEDNGRGIPPEVLPRIFEPFFTTRPPGQGVGLGLSVSRQLATTAGGSLVVTSAGSGALATLILPSQPEPALRWRVLVVDDDKTVARALHRLLRHHCEVDVVTDPAVALEDLRAPDARWDAVVCDLVMPKVSGRMLHDGLMDRRPEMAARIVFLTGGSVAEHDPFADRMLRAGRLFHKPPDREVLLRAIAAAAAR